MKQFTDAKIEMKQKNIFENKEQNNLNLMSSEQRNNGNGLQILCDATIIESKIDTNWMKEQDLKMIRSILEVGPYGELKESIHQIREILLHRVRWEADSLVTGFLSNSDATLISSIFRRMFFGNTSDQLRSSFLKFLTNSSYKCSSWFNPRLKGVVHDDMSLRQHLHTLASEIHSIVISCDIAYLDLDLTKLYSNDTLEEINKNRIFVPSCENVFEELYKIQVRAAQNIYLIG